MEEDWFASNMCFDENDFERPKDIAKEEGKDELAIEISKIEKRIEEQKELKKKLAEIRASGRCESIEHPNIARIIRDRFLTKDDAVFTENAWDDVEWDEETFEQAKKAVTENSSTFLEEEQAQGYLSNANSYWHKFYNVHEHKFFKDRKWLFSEFPELEAMFLEHPCEATGSTLPQKQEAYIGENSKFKIMEVGCGAGNTIFPLLSVNPNNNIFLYCCDFAESAVELVKNNEDYNSSRILAFVHDITQPNSLLPIPEGCLDAITMIFVLSAIPRSKFVSTLSNMHKILKPGGVLLFRDYGLYDLAQTRIKKGKCLAQNCYVRGDGTLVSFFEKGKE